MKKTALLLDFRDSFTHNLLGLLECLNYKVVLEDYSNIKTIDLLSFDLLILGPGPGHISDYSEVLDSIPAVMGKTPILGICLGHQILGHLAGFGLSRLDEPLHGRSIKLSKLSKILGLGDFKGQFYNSWSLDHSEVFRTDCRAIRDRNMVVAIAGPKFVGLQFHPESVGTTCPKLVLENSINLMYDEVYDRTNGWCIRPTNHQIPTRTKS